MKLLCCFGSEGLDDWLLSTTDEEYTSTLDDTEAERLRWIIQQNYRLSNTENE